ncbi:MAG TPA: dienelactone hydrolase family protein [Candidatus Tectomicrobia bacterium]
MPGSDFAQLVHIAADAVTIEGMLVIPGGAPGIVLFAHGSGSSRHSPRNTFVAEVLQRAGLGTLLIDLLSQEEDMSYETRFDIHLLANRLTAATQWLQTQPPTKDLGIGYFGASTGAAAALQAAAALGPVIRAVVSRGGRPDLAWAALEHVQAPTLLILGGRDDVVIELNQGAHARLHADKQLVIVPGATHVFEEPGALPEVARLAAAWFSRYLPPQTAPDR